MGRGWWSSRVRAAVASSVLVLAPSVARAGDPAAAREQLKIGYTLAQQGRCDEALPHLVESLRLDVKAITLINLASCEEKTRHLADALGHWVDARARAQAEGVPAIEEEAVKRTTALEARMPRLTIVLGEGAPRGTEVVRDGIVLGAVSLGVALPIDPGPHVIVARAPGRVPSSKTISIEEGESARVDVAPGGTSTEPMPGSTPPAVEARATDATSQKARRPVVWAGFGTALAGAAVGTITGIAALSRANEAERDCPQLTCRDQASLDSIHTGRTLGTISTVAFVVAGIGAGVGVVGLLSGGRSRTTYGANVSFGVGPNGAAVAGRF